MAHGHVLGHLLHLHLLVLDELTRARLQEQRRAARAAAACVAVGRGTLAYWVERLPEHLLVHLVLAAVAGEARHLD